MPTLPCIDRYITYRYPRTIHAYVMVHPCTLATLRVRYSICLNWPLTIILVICPIVCRYPSVFTYYAQEKNHLHIGPSLAWWRSVTTPKLYAICRKNCLLLSYKQLKSSRTIFTTPPHSASVESLVSAVFLHIGQPSFALMFSAEGSIRRCYSSSDMNMTASLVQK